MTTPRTEAGRALLDSIRSGVASLFAVEYSEDDDPIRDAILAIEAQSLSVERLAGALHVIEPNLTCIATRNIPASFDCTKPDIDRAAAILAALDGTR